MRNRDSVRRPMLIALALALITGLTACGANGNVAGQITLRYTFWGNAERAGLYQEAVDLFMEKNPNIVVDTNFSSDSYFQKLSTEAAGGNTPDVLQTDFAYFAELGARGVIADLKPQLGKNLHVDDLVPGLKKTGWSDGKYYAVPVSRNTTGMHYDAKLWKAAGNPEPKLGWTWEDYERAARRVTEYTGGKQYGGSDLAWGARTTLEAYLLQHGKRLYDADGSLGFTERDLVGYWKLAARLRKAGATAPPSVTIEAKPGSPVPAKLTASEIEWDPLVVGNSSTYGSPLSLAPLPTDTGELGQYVKGAMFMSVAKDTPHQDEATKLIDFFINEPEVARILGANRGLAPTTTQRAAVKLDGVDAEVQRYEDSVMPRLKPAPPPPPVGGLAVERTLNRINEKVGFGQVSPEQGARDFFSAAEATLESSKQAIEGGAE